MADITYGQSIRWTERSGAVTTVTVGGFLTHEAALQEAWDFAYASGWEQPRWWQWWRWRDVPYIPQELTGGGELRDGTVR